MPTLFTFMVKINKQESINMNFTYGKLSTTTDTIESLVQSPTRIEDTDHVFLSAEPDFDGTSYIGRAWDRPVYKADSLTARQARLVLHNMGRLADVPVAINNMAVGTKEKVLIEWDYAATIVRDNALVIELGTALGLTDAEIDQMFIDGSKL